VRNNKANTIILTEEREELRLSPYCNDPALIADYNDCVASMTKALSYLPARMERVLRMYYGFNIEGMTMKGIAETIHTYHSSYGEHTISVTRVRQIISKAERYLRHPARRVWLDARLQYWRIIIKGENIC
jgi:DNA-directed RNA polymerase sigma subunit (sigma70/sigma32)